MVQLQFYNVYYAVIMLVIFIYGNNGDKVEKTESEVLIVVSYDAFRNEYFERNLTENMNKMRKEGTYADYMVNVFPTKTFPNHHSIATGVFPDKHGVMSNSLFDHKMGYVNYTYELFHYDEDILPIWILNELSGKYSGCMMWPGSDFTYTYKNISCTYVQKLDFFMSWEKRVDKVMDWIKSPSKSPNLIMLYIEEPDLHGHAFGPESNEISKNVANLDKLSKYLKDKITENKLQDLVNVIHLSDHGMDSLMPKNFINLTDFVPSNLTYKMYGTTPILQIVPTDLKQTENLYNYLNRAAIENGHFKVYKNDTLPTRWHYYNPQRTGPITAVARLGYGFDDMWTSVAYYEKTYNITVKSDNKYGVHGYDNEVSIMHPFFFAYGPLIKEAFQIKPFNTVDLYFLFCEILKLKTPFYLSGNREHIIGILKEPSEDDDPHSRVTPAMMIVIFMGSLLSSFILVSFLAMGMVLRRRRRDNQVPSYLYDENETFVDEQNKLLHSQSTSINGDVRIEI